MIDETGMDEKQRHDWRVRVLLYGEYPESAYCDVCGGLLFKDEVGSTQCPYDGGPHPPPSAAELFVVCSWRRQLSIPLRHLEALDYMASLAGKFEQLNVVPFTETRTWGGH